MRALKKMSSVVAHARERRTRLERSDVWHRAATDVIGIRS
jgi:hypothetical protein